MPTMSRAAQDFTVSAAAAALAHVIHHPLYTLKSQMMYHGPNFRLSEFVQNAFLKKNGFSGFLYRGLISRTIGIMPEKALKMFAWTTVGRYVEKAGGDKYLKYILAGCAAGAATTIVGCPSERIMVLAQVSKQGFFDVVRRSGMTGLLNGWQSTLYRDVVFNCLFFTSREIFVHMYAQRKGDEPFAFTRVLIGWPAGCLAAVVACPLDVIKTRIQGQKLGGPSRSVMGVFSDIVRHEGPRHLMKGLLPRVLVVPMYMSVFYVFNEELEKRFIKE